MSYSEEDYGWGDSKEPDYLPVEIQSLRHCTAKALLAVIDGDDVWIPRSLVENGYNLEPRGQSITLNVEGWFVDQEDL